MQSNDSLEAKVDPRGLKIQEKKSWSEFFFWAYQKSLDLDKAYGNNYRDNPINLSSTNTQSLIKRVYQNMVEEVAELYEYLDKAPQYFGQGKKLDISGIPPEILQGLHDELADVLSFGTVFITASGMDKPTEDSGFGHFITEALEPHMRHLESYASLEVYNGKYISIFSFLNSVTSTELIKVVYEFGMCCNMLKNRPWKNSHYPVDNPAYHKQVIKAWGRLAYMVATLALDLKTMEKAVESKVNKNYFRISSGY